MSNKSFPPYGGLKENSFTWSGTIRRSDFVGVDVALLENVCHCGCGSDALRSPVLKLHSVWYTVHFLFTVDRGVELSAPSPAPCLPACSHVLS